MTKPEQAESAVLTDEQIEQAARSSGAYSEIDRRGNDTGDLIVSVPQLRYFLDEIAALAAQALPVPQADSQLDALEVKVDRLTDLFLRLLERLDQDVEEEPDPPPFGQSLDIESIMLEEGGLRGEVRIDQSEVVRVGEAPFIPDSLDRP